MNDAAYGELSGWPTFFRSAALDNYVCGHCGYVESYIAREKDLAAIKIKWSLVI